MSGKRIIPVAVIDDQDLPVPLEPVRVEDPPVVHRPDPGPQGGLDLDSLLDREGVEFRVLVLVNPAAKARKGFCRLERRWTEDGYARHRDDGQPGRISRR